MISRDHFSPNPLFEFQKIYSSSQNPSSDHRSEALSLREFGSNSTTLQSLLYLLTHVILRFWNRL
ncbi:hypothetical protein LEP1GSC137_2636 [Leptospira borgpetersenii str. Noumea 25]|nr:hypothetical protein LEP1GSC137_2636 [Leptospira borgpetersenii str. Noumea 25]